eukprot:g8718.t1
MIHDANVGQTTHVALGDKNDVRFVVTDLNVDACLDLDIREVVSDRDAINVEIGNILTLGPEIGVGNKEGHPACFAGWPLSKPFGSLNGGYLGAESSHGPSAIHVAFGDRLSAGVDPAVVRRFLSWSLQPPGLVRCFAASRCESGRPVRSAGREQRQRLWCLTRTRHAGRRSLVPITGSQVFASWAAFVCKGGGAIYAVPGRVAVIRASRAWPPFGAQPAAQCRTATPSQWWARAGIPTARVLRLNLAEQAMAQPGMTAATDPKTELNHFCQRYCQRPVTKADISYTTNKFGNQYQSIVKLDCIQGQEYAGHLCLNQKEAEKSAAEQAVMAFRPQMASLPPPASKDPKKKKERPRLTPAELAAKKAKQAEERDISPEYAQVDGAEIAYLARPDEGENPAVTPKTKLNALVMKIAKRYLQKGETIYETKTYAGGGHQATVQLKALPGEWGNRVWAGHVSSTKQKAEQSAAEIALKQISEDSEMVAEAAKPKGVGKGKGKGKGKGFGLLWGWDWNMMWGGGSGPNLPREKVSETPMTGEVVGRLVTQRLCSMGRFQVHGVVRDRQKASTWARGSGCSKSSGFSDLDQTHASWTWHLDNAIIWHPLRNMPPKTWRT